MLPLLAFIRPAREVRAALKWEGVLVDPIGALLGVAVFQAASSSGGSGWRPGELAADLVVGSLVAAVGAVVLWLVLREVQENAPRLAVASTLAVVVAVVVAADLLREDTGFVAATVMGIALGNQRFLAPSRRIDVTLTLEFEETLVQLLIGVLFVLIAASVSPADARAVLPETLALVAVMVLVIRPVAVALSTWRSRFDLCERAFIACMAPRGIVAGATASAFGVSLTADGVEGAGKILPIVFVTIFATVVVYGLTSPLAARLLGQAGRDRGLVLVVGGHPWAREVATALRAAGVPVRVWVGRAEDRRAAVQAGLDADRGTIMVDAVSKEAELEEVTDALLLTRSDDFNAMAAAELRSELGHRHVHRVAPTPRSRTCSRRRSRAR